MIRGSTPTFTFLLPADASSYNGIDVNFTQSGSMVLLVPKSRLTAAGRSVSFRMTEEESLLFTDAAPAEIQLRLALPDGGVLLSEIRRLAVRRNNFEA